MKHEERPTDGALSHQTFVESLVDKMIGYVWAIDLDLNYTYHSPAVKAMTGYEPDDLLGENIEIMVHPDDIGIAVSMLAQEIEAERHEGPDPERAKGMEMRIKRKDGIYIWVEFFAMFLRDGNGEPYGVVGITRDISNRKKAEEALKEREEKFRALAESTSDWIWEVDARGNFTYVSPKVKDIIGYEPEDLLGRSPMSLAPQAESKRIGEFFMSTAKEKKAFTGFENINLHKNGQPKVLETNGVPFLDHDGNLLGYRGVNRDITDRKRADDTLKQRTRELGERIKEQRCLYTITSLMTDPEITIDKMMDRTVGVLPSSFRFPDICCARIRCKGKDHSYPKWKDSDIKINSPLIVKGEKVGIIEVAYYEDRSTGIGGPFVPEERQLLGTIATLLSDFLKRRAIEETVKENEERYRTLFEQTPDGIAIFTVEGTITDCNDSFLTVTGRSRQETVGENFIALSHFTDDQIEDFGERFMQLLEEGFIEPFELEWTKPSGGHVWLEVTSNAFRTGGEITALQVIVRDVSERKKEDMEQKLHLEKLKQENAELERMLKPMSEKPFKPGAKTALEPSNCYILLEPNNEGAVRRFMDHVLHGHQGLFITRKNPVHLRKTLDLPNTPFIWLTNNDHEGELCIQPSNIQKLASAITSFLDKSTNGIVLFTGLEYLAVQNGFKSLMNLLYLLNDRMMTRDDILIASVNPKAYLPQDLHILTSELTLIDRGFEDLASE